MQDPDGVDEVQETEYDKAQGVDEAGDADLWTEQIGQQAEGPDHSEETRQLEREETR